MQNLAGSCPLRFWLGSLRVGLPPSACDWLRWHGLCSGCLVVWPGVAWRGLAWLGGGWARRCFCSGGACSRCGSGGFARRWLDLARLSLAGLASLGLAWLGEAWLLLWRGWPGLGSRDALASLCSAWLGLAWLLFWPGLAWFGYCWMALYDAIIPL